MNKISCNLSNVITLISAGTSRGNELIINLLPQNTSAENGKWAYEKITEDGSVQMSNVQDMEQTQKEKHEYRLREQFQTIANPPPGTIDNSDESSTNSEQR